MNPLTASDGSSKCEVVRGRVWDDGNFFTQNKPTLGLRAFRITDSFGQYVMGVREPRAIGWREKKDPKPSWILTRDELKNMDFNVLTIGGYNIRVWGVNDDDPEYFEIGSEDAAHAGHDVVISTYFMIDPQPVPPNEKEELINVLIATREVNSKSLPFKLGWRGARTIDRYLIDAIARAKRL